MMTHPSQALFEGEKSFPVLSACEHFAGSEKLILKAMELQAELGPVFDITCDCEDGAAAGNEAAHAQMVARLVNDPRNRFQKAGVRIHDPAHPMWRQDVDLVVGQAAERLAYVTIPKATRASQASEVIDRVQQVARASGARRAIPIHILIETHGALAEIAALAALPHVEVLDFGQMDFVSGHHGAIAASAMRSPGQFEHALLVRAKAEVVAAAIRNGVVPAHNVCLNLKDADVIRGDAHRARMQFGFMRMWSIHPAQIRPIVDAMQPAFDEVRDAAAILCAAQDAQWGPIQYQGELHDRATYRYFWSVLERAKATGLAIPEPAGARFFGA
jgi:citrate lyase subunit beta / citryl-CoA lyase